ncbi:MAG: hypothetical protein AAGE94_06370 [Acidobacteriota bacterium]
MTMRRPPVEAVIEVMQAKDYRVYDTPGVDWNLNVVGIRAADREEHLFDDLLLVFHRFLGVWDITYYPITTEPSLRYLRQPIHPDGTAVLVEGQYRGAYRIDVHRRGRRGGHKALCQRGGEVEVYRDANRDDRVDRDLDSIQSGFFGINIHKGPRGGDASSENTIFSAGCQVFADDRHFDEFLTKCEHGRVAFGNSFTYTLLHERDFDAL